MDKKELPVKFKDGGSEYLASLERLGLRPDALFWAYDTTIDGFVLVLVTEAYDFAGPLGLSKILFQAYNKAATPIEIDPFVVRMHSPRHSIIRELAKYPMEAGVAMTVTNPDGSPLHGVTATFANVTSADLIVDMDWIYRFERSKKPKTIDIARRWKRFSTNVEKLAA